jgi:hypothetical protein
VRFNSENLVLSKYIIMIYQKNEIIGSDKFWKFVDDINWVSRPSDKEVEETKSWYSKQELKQFREESDYLSGLISQTIYSDEYQHVWFGGCDDFCMMDLPAEVVGRGKDFFLEHVNNVDKLIKFGTEGDIEECFDYIFHDEEDSNGLEDIIKM